MACYSEGPSQDEIEAGKLNALLDELAGHHAHGYRPDRDLNRWARHAGQRPAMDNDARARELCRQLAKMSRARIKRLSLEMQLWWRDHQAFDRRRRAEQQQVRRTRVLRQQALRKLTPAERRALQVRP